MIDYSVIVIEDDLDVQIGCIQALALEDIKAVGASSVEEARALIPDARFNGVIITDLRLPGMNGMDFQQELNTKSPDIPVIIITGHGDIETAVRAMHNGAYDFLQKPFPPQQLVSLVRRALDKRRLMMEIYDLRRMLADTKGLENRLIGNSQEMTDLRELVKDIAVTPANVMIYGETGSGKEMLARCIHEISGREGPFVALNCGGLPETLFESEIFGHEAGAFSGASKQRIGKLEYANHGTLFLDEIESMPMALQIKLLRVLQERVIERLGSNQTIPIDIRVISATKADLAALADKNEFREDLVFRLNVVNIKIPPLREHIQDIPILFNYFVEGAARSFERPAPEIKDDKIRNLLGYRWPGNIRELRNEAERFVLGLKEQLGDQQTDNPISLSDRVENFERGLILMELNHQQGNMSKTAEALKLAKSTLFDKIKKYQINLDS